MVEHASRRANAGADERPVVLIADDDTDFRVAVAEVLVAEGFDVMTAATGRQVVDVAMTSRPNVVLLDHRMPEMTGMDACRLLRHRGFVGPVILMTAGEDLDAMSRAVGTKYQLEKPFDVDDLVVLVRKAIADRGMLPAELASHGGFVELVERG